MRFIGDIALDAEVRAIASGAITVGEPVVVNSTGTVSGIITPASAALGTEVLFHNSDNNDQASIFIPDTNKILIAYKDEGNSSYGTVRVATIDSSDNSVSYGSEIVFNSGQTSKVVATYDTNSDRVVIGYANSNASRTGKAIVGTVSGSSVSFGTAVTFNDKIDKLGVTFDSNSNKVVFGYEDANNSGHGTAIVGTLDSSDNSISFGSEAVYKAADTSNIGMCFDSNSNKVIIAYRHNADSSKGEAIVGTISGTDITYGSATVFNSVNTQQFDKSVVFDSSNNKVVIIYKDSGGSGNTEALVGTVSGTSISFGSLATVGDSDGGPMSATFDSDNNNIILAYQDDGDDGNISIGTVSGTDISFNTPVEFASSAAITPMSIAYDPNTKRALITFTDYDNSSNGFGIVFKSAITTNITTENFIGFAHAAYADGQKATLKTTGSIARNVPAQLAAGSAGTPVVPDEEGSFISATFDSNSNRVVVAYQDGDNSNYGTAVVGTITASDKSISFGTPVVFNSANTYYTESTFDSNSNKVVITYRNIGDSNRGTAIVSTVDPSDNSISFGTAVVYEAGETINSSATFDSSNNKVVIAYEDEDDSQKGKAIVGTVSGTAISFGTAAVFNNANTGFTSTAFDTTNNKVVIAFADKGNSNKGTAIVGTVSGTDISFGSEAIFNSGTSAEIHHSISFNPVAGKMLIAYVDTDDGEKGKAIVGTVSGTSISFGTASVYNTRPEQSETVYDSAKDLIVIVYGDNNNSRRGTAIGATISGTSVSFSTELAFHSSTGNKNGIRVTYDSNSDQAVAAYTDAGNSNVLTTTVFATAGNGPLVIGQQYFVQTDGTLGTSADSPSVIAGTAIGASDIVVKG